MRLSYAVFGVFVFCFSNLGCSDATSADESSTNEEWGVSQQLLLEDCGTDDAESCLDIQSGPLTARIYRCAPVEGAHVFAECSVGSDFALVGGGAEIIGSPEPGAMLTDSYPGNNAWAAKSKDHIHPNDHDLRVYAIGLRLDGLTGAELRPLVKTKRSLQVWGNHPTAEVYLPDLANNVMLSGGGDIVPGSSNPGMLMVRSSPNSSTGPWVVGSKDHILYNEGALKAHMVYMPKCPPKVSYCLESRMASSVWSSTGGGYRSATYSNAIGSVPVGVGAIQSSPGGNRLLTDMFPRLTSTGGVTATSKDHDVADSGRIQAVLMTLRSIPK